MKVICTALAFVAIAIAPAGARAEVVTDPLTDFSIDVGLSGDTCVVIPRERANSRLCAQIASGSLADSLERAFDQPFYAVAARSGDGLMVLSISREEVHDPLRPDQLGPWAEDLRSQTAANARLALPDPQPAPHIEHVKGIDVAVVPMLGAQLAGERTIEEAITSYTLFGERASYRIVISTDPAHADEASDDVLAALATTKLAPAAVVAPKTTTLSGDIRDHARAVAIAAVVLFALIFAAWRFTRDPPAPETPEGPRFRTRKRKVVSWEKHDP